jgi:biotin carboxylase
MNHSLTKISFIILAVFFIAKVSILIYAYREIKDRRNCIDFPSQVYAQKIYEQDRGAWSKLDGDNDGLACEALKRKVI